MAQTAFKGSPVQLSGDLPRPGTTAPEFIDGQSSVAYAQLVDDISQEPDYAKAMACLSSGAVLQACTASFTAEHSRSMNDDGPCDDGRAGG